MELNKQNIESYIHRFLEGETTNAEEQALYRFFRKGDVPAHLQDYAPMFAWYEAGMPEERLAPATQLSAPVPEKKKRFRLHMPVTAWSAGIAAMVVITLGLGLLFYADDEKPRYPEGISCYEGSYIEVGGKRITDIKQIMPLLLEEQAAAERKEKLAEQRICEIEKREKYVREKEMTVD